MKAKNVLNQISELVEKDVIEDEVGKFWVVLFATPESELVDILFESDIFDIMIMAKGGLRPNDILAIFKNKVKAKKYAEDYLNEYKKGLEFEPK